MMKHSGRLVCLIAGIMLLVYTGCGGGGGGGGGGDDRIDLRNHVWIDPAIGGSAAIKTTNGDIVQVVLPARSINTPFTLTLTEMEYPASGPFEECFFPGVRIDPENEALLAAALLRVRFAAPLSDPNSAMLFHEAGDNTVLALKQSSGADEIRADIYQTGIYRGCRPMTYEAESILDAGIYSNSTRWQDTLAVVNALNAWASFFTSQRWYDEAERARRMVEENIRNDVNDFLLENVPEGVMAAFCNIGRDVYADSAVEYQKMLRLLGEPAGLTEALRDRLEAAFETGAGRLLDDDPVDPCGAYRDCVADYIELLNANDFQHHWTYQALKTLRSDLDENCGS